MQDWGLWRAGIDLNLNGDADAGWDLLIGLGDENQVLIVFDTGIVVFSLPTAPRG